MIKKWIALVISAAFMLTACNSPVYNQTENNVADVKLKAKAARQKSDASAMTRPPLLVEKGPYVDRTPISLYKNPSWLREHIVIKGDQLPFSYFARTIAAGASGGVLTKYQSGLDSSIKVSMNFSGTVRGALDLLASKSGYVFNVQGSSVYWQAFVTKTYDIAFIPGGADYLVGKKGGSSTTNANSNNNTQSFTTTDSSNDQYSNMGGKLSVWADLENAVKQLLTSDGKVTVSQATTTVTVRDRPTAVALVTQFINNLNNKLSKQVLVKIQVLSVDLENDYDMGINWQVVARAFNKSPFILNGNYGTPISITSFVTQSAVNATGTPAPPVPQFGTTVNNNATNQIPSYTILFNALSQQGKTSVVTEPRIVCLNNQVSVIRITQQTGYAAAIQNTTLASGGTAPTSTVTSQVTPGNIVTGVTMYILPKILNNKIYMQVNADLSLLVALESFGATGSTIQLPTVASKSFNQRGVIRSGETLILSGFRQLSNQAKAMQLMKSQALGGKAAQQLNSETVVLITPIILDGYA